MQIFKDAQVKFQADRVGNVYMLQNSEATVDGCSYPQLQDRMLWNKQRLCDFKREC